MYRTAKPTKTSIKDLALIEENYGHLFDVDHTSNYISKSNKRDFQLTCKTCNFTFKKQYAGLKKDPTCPACKRKLRKKRSQQKYYNKYLAIITKALTDHPGSKLLTPIQGVMDEKTKIQCAEGHIITPIITDLRTNNSWCGACYRKQKQENFLLGRRDRKKTAKTTKKKETQQQEKYRAAFDQLKQMAESLGLEVKEQHAARLIHHYHFTCLICGKEIKKRLSVIWLQYKREANSYACCKECDHLWKEKYYLLEQYKLFNDIRKL
jgi:hypothetical protein